MLDDSGFIDHFSVPGVPQYREQAARKNDTKAKVNLFMKTSLYQFRETETMADIFIACLLIPYSIGALVSLVFMPVCKPVHSLCLQVVYLHAVQCLKGISRHMHSVTMGPDTLQARISQFEKERIRCSICLHFTTLPFYCQYMFCHFNEKRLQSHNAGRVLHEIPAVTITGVQIGGEKP